MLVFSCSGSEERQIDTSTQKSFDSIKVYIIQNNLGPLEVDSLLKTITLDSVRLNLLQDLSLHYLLLENDSTKFRLYNKRTSKLSQNFDFKKIEADSYWDLGFFFTKRNILDSAYLNYYRAYKLYRSEEQNDLAGKMLLNMAISQEKVKDYLGSEITTVESLKILPADQKKQIYRAYNNLAVVANGLENYSQALKYHERALEIAQSINDKKLIAQSLNNKGFVYQNMGHFGQALIEFKRAIVIEDLKKLDIQLFAIVLENISFTELKLGRHDNFLKTSDYVLKIRDSLKHETGIIASKINRAQYFSKISDTVKTIQLLEEAKYLSKSIKSTKYELRSLKELAEIDRINSTEYLKEFIAINDSLLKEERSIRNKFARIRYETDQYIEETELLSQQKFWISITALITTCGLILLYYYREQYNKFKKLRLQKEQQESNERIYNLLLNQQTKLEEGRQEERKRISGDLHDGILGRLFGTRMGLGFLKPYANSNRIDDYLLELQNIEKDIRNISHNLSTDISDSSESFHNLIDQLVKEKNEISKISFNYHFEESFDFDQISNDVKINLYRLVQECLQNAIKHSKAKNVFVTFRSAQNFLYLTIEDDGQGFDIKKKKKGIGLSNMKFRVHKLGGNMNLKSSGQGTSFIFKIAILKDETV
ncbi:tetratricopeptide repeat-containing sensor histidine kinase [Christiangramia forsetii]|uniref:histidine kinase n=2 Tax=Christiangramia forsetii TaxID=411153 RepID=A0LYJ8_CHRFK|nr:tetratricopeptide repeat-containing sensor histidine kinase [Christiangramia forsetii]GGG34015.1 hypothetical protein GCM10011532_17120 [Christiangramia forsetii]CAL65443.1 two-component system sensor histidine kinase [Christiangramia forsetii KT0803]